MRVDETALQAAARAFSIAILAAPHGVQRSKTHNFTFTAALLLGLAGCEKGPLSTWLCTAMPPEDEELLWDEEVDEEAAQLDARDDVEDLLQEGAEDAAGEPEPAAALATAQQQPGMCHTLASMRPGAMWLRHAKIRAALPRAIHAAAAAATQAGNGVEAAAAVAVAATDKPAPAAGGGAAAAGAEPKRRFPPARIKPPEGRQPSALDTVSGLSQCGIQKCSVCSLQHGRVPATHVLMHACRRWASPRAPGRSSNSSSREVAVARVHGRVAQQARAASSLRKATASTSSSDLTTRPTWIFRCRRAGGPPRATTRSDWTRRSLQALRWA